MTDAAAHKSFIERQAPATVVVFRALQLGDMLCAVPALRALRAALPTAHIALVGLPWARQFVQRFHHYVNEFIAFPGHADFPEQPVQNELLADFYAAMRARRFDMAVQLHGGGPQSNLITRAFGARCMVGYGDAPTVHHEHFAPYPERGAEPQRLLNLLAAVGVPSLHADLEFPITPDDERELADSGQMASIGVAPYICVHPGARWRDKCWHPARFARVADQLAHEFGVRIVLTGSAQEAELAATVGAFMKTSSVNTASPLSIGAMAAIFRNARLILANDTGVSHMAAGLRVPSVIVFSKSDMGRWAPVNTQLHRCLWDPDGERIEEVVQQARELLGSDAIACETSSVRGQPAAPCTNGHLFAAKV